MKRRSILWILLLLELLLFGASGALAQNDYTTTPNLALKLPKSGSTNWGIYVNQDFTTLDAAVGQFHGGFVVEPYSTTPVFNLLQGNTFQLTLQGNVSSSTVNQPGITPGQFLYLIICQNSTGGNTFTFPASFQAPLPSVTATPNLCSASTWLWSGSFSRWINVSGGGSGGGGGTPTAPNRSMQYDNFGSFGASSLLFTPSNASCTYGGGITCDDYVLPATNVCLSATFAADTNITFGNTWILCDIGAPTIAAGISGAHLDINSTSRLPASRAVPIVVSATALGNGTNATGIDSAVSDDPLDASNGPASMWAYRAVIGLTRAVGAIGTISAYEVTTPFNLNTGSGPPGAESVGNLYGLHVQDLLGKGSTRTAAIQIDAQTNAGIAINVDGGLSKFDTASSSLFASTNANPSTSGFLRLATGDQVCWRNFANNANICLAKNNTDVLNWNGAFSAGPFVTASNNPAASGEVRLANAELICWRNNTNSGDVCVGKNSSDATTLPAFVVAADQSGLWAHGAFTEGFKANGSLASNLLWSLPLTDSTGTQCLSSNGSGGLAWSNCSAGSGTPGGATGNVQYNNVASFAGSNAFTFNGTGTVGIGQLNTVLGILNMFGNTSGTVTIQPQATAGTATLTLPNTTGTFAVGASAPLALSATTGNLTCATCDNSAATLTANQLVIGAGTHTTAALGSLGTTTTVLHGNAAGAPSFGAVNLATDVTGITAIANGGTGQSAAGAAFNALSPITSVGDLIIGTGVNTASRLAIGGNGLCLTSNGTTAAWSSCAAGSVGGSATAGQATFFVGTSTIGGSANWTYASGTGQSLTQGANNVDAFYMKRFTDSAPTGNFLRFQNAAAAADVFKVDVLGNITALSLVFNGTNAGGVTLVQGPAPPLIPNAIEIIAPTAVAASGEQFVFPGNPSNGFLRWTNAAGVLTGTLVAGSGVGTCSGTQLVSQVNDNAPPTCVNVLASMFTSQAANTGLMAPSGSNGVPTFRLIVNADLPTIILNSNANGGVTNILQVPNGGTGAATASAGFNNLSPMTTAGDIIYGGSAGAGTRLAAGTSTQVLISGTTPSWGAVNLATMTTGTTAIANGGTGQVTAGAAFNALAPATSVNGLIYATGTNAYGNLPAGGAGTLCLVEISGGTPAWSSCSGSASTSWSNLSNPGADLSLSMGTNNSLFTSGVMTGTRNMWEFVDGNSTSTGSNHFIHTGASSTMKPLTVTAQGTANGIQMDTTGSLGVIGTGNIVATKLSRTITTTAPLTIGGGGSADLTADRTIACATCVTSGASLGNNNVVIGSGGGQGVADAGFTGNNVVRKDAANTGAAAMTLDLSACTGANCFRIPSQAGWTSGTAGSTGYDSTAKITHIFTNGADSNAAATTSTSTTTTQPLFATAVAGIYNPRAIAAADMPVVLTRRVCDIGIGDTSGSAITNGQLGPQKRGCYIPMAATIVEMDVSADAGTPNVIVGKNTAGTQLNIVSAALATAASGGIACSNTGGTTGIDGATTCSATLQNTSLAAGAYLELVSGTAGGTAKWMTVHVIYTVN